VALVYLEVLSASTEKSLGTIAIALKTDDNEIFVHSNTEPAVRPLSLHFCVLFYDDISDRLHNTSIRRTEVDLEESVRSLAG
jgi:hypothetical protein